MGRFYTKIQISSLSEKTNVFRKHVTGKKEQVPFDGFGRSSVGLGLHFGLVNVKAK